MAKSPINIFNINNKKKTITREQIIKEKFNGLQGAELEAAINKELTMQYIFGAEERKKIVEFTADTVILGSKAMNEVSSPSANMAFAKKTYENISPVFNYIKDIDKHLKSKQTANELVANALELDYSFNYSKTSVKANTTKQTINEAIDNFNNADVFYAYDLETLPGTNGVDSVQEIAFRKYIKKDGKITEDVSGRLETLVGIDPSSAKFKEYQDFINNFDTQGVGPNGEYKVIADRLAKVGHADTKLNWDAGHGIVTTELFASDQSANLLTKENLQRGLDTHAKIWEKQNKERLKNGLTVYEDMLLRTSSVASNNFTVSFNGKGYDDPILNQQIAAIWNNLSSHQKDEYKLAYGIGKNNIPGFSYKSNMNLDMRDVFRLGLEQDGKSSLYTDDQLRNLVGTLLQQETIGRAFFADKFSTAAHTAGNDVDILAHIAGSLTEDGDTLLQRMQKRMNANKTADMIVDNNTIFMANQAEFFNDWSKKNALSFTTDTRNNAIRTFNGFEIGETVKDMGPYGKSYGIKKDVAYRIKKSGKLEMTEDFINQIRKTNQEYAQGDLFFATFAPVIDKSIAGGNNILEEEHTYIFNSRDAFESMVSSHFSPIGAFDKDGKIQELSGKSADLIKAAYREVQVTEDGVKFIDNGENLTSRLISNGTHKAKNDAAARMIREHDYGKMKKFMAYQNYVEDNAIELEKILKAVNPQFQNKSRIEMQKAALSLATAEKVARGEVLRIQDDIAAIFGYTDRLTNSTYAWSNTINNMMNSLEYQSSLSHVYGAIINEVETVYKNSSEEKKAMIAQNLLSNIMNDAENEFGSTNKMLKLYQKDLDYFEFDMPEGYFKHSNKKAFNGDIDNVLRINLQPEKEYSLVNDLLRRRYGDDRIVNKAINKETYGKAELVNFIEEVNRSEKYKGIFDELIQSKDVTNLKQKIRSRKNDKKDLIQETYRQLDEQISILSANKQQNIEKERQVIRSLFEQRDALKSNHSSSVKEYINNISQLSDDFVNTFVSSDIWFGLSEEAQDRIKDKQKAIHNKQIELSEAYQQLKSRHENEIAAINEKISDQYTNLFDALDANPVKGEKQATRQKINEIKQLFKDEIDELYHGFNDIENFTPAYESMDANTLAEKIQLTLRRYRDDNPTAGFSKTREYQNVEEAYEHASKMTEEFISNSIKKASKTNADLKIIDPKNRKTIQDEAEKMINAMFMPKVTSKDGKVSTKIADVVTFAQKTYGYNDELADIIKMNLETTKADYMNAFTNFISGVAEHKGMISYNEKQGAVHLLMGGEQYNITKLLPKTRFENGVLLRDLVLTKTNAHLEYNIKDAIVGTSFVNNKVNVVSDLHEALSALNYTSAQLNKAKERGQDIGKTALSILERVSKTIRGNAYQKNSAGSSIGKGTLKDTAAIQKIGFHDILAALPYNMDRIKSYKGWQEPELVSILERNKKSLLKGVISSEVLEGVQKDMNDIIKIVIGETPGEEIQRNDYVGRVSRLFNSNSKDTDSNKYKGFLGSYDIMSFLNLDNEGRPNTHQFTNTKTYSSNYLTNFVNNREHNLKNKDIQVGSKLTTNRQSKVGRRTIEGLGNTEIGVVGNVAAVSEKTFKDILSNEKKKRGNLDSRTQKIFDQLSSMNLTEQAKIMDGHVFEMLMKDSEIQTVKTLKNISRDLSTNNKVMRDRINDALYSIEIVNDAEIVFKLGKKQLVKRNDPLLALEGFAGVTDTIATKENFGLFGIGFAAKNTDTLIDEKEINKFLNKHKDQIISNGIIDINKANQLLEESFDSIAYVSNLFSKRYNKIWIEGPEKSMAQGLLSHLGEIDENIEHLLKTVGLDDFIGYTAQTSTLDTLVDDIIMPKFNLLSEAEKNKLKYKDAKEIKTAIKNELFATTDFINSIDAFSDISVFGIDNTMKHKNAGVATRQLIQNIAYKISKDEGLSEAEAYKKATEIVNKSNLFDGMTLEYKDGSIMTGHKDDYSVNIAAAKELQEKYNLSTTYQLNDGQEITINKSRSLIGANYDESKISMSNPEVDSIINELKDIRSKMKLANADELASLQETERYLEHKLVGAKATDKRMKVGRRATNNLSLFEYDQVLLDKVKGSLDEESYNKIFKHMLDEDGSISKKYLGQKIHSSALAQFEEQFESKLADNKDFMANGAAAMRFNAADSNLNNAKDRLFSEKVKDKFTEASIDDIVLPYGDNSKFLLNEENAIFNKNLLIKTSTGEHVAIPALDAKIVGDSAVAGDIVKSISALERSELRLQDGINGKLASNETVADLRLGVTNAIEGVKNSVDKAVRATYKDMDTIEIGKSIYAKANMVMHVDGSDMNSALFDKATFAGKSLSSHIEKGNYVSAAWAGEEFFSEYINNYEKYGMKTKEEMLNYLETKGTIGITTRSPDIREGSTVFTTTYLKRGLKNQIIVTDSIAERANQDHDGDGRSLAELVHKATGETYASWTMKGENVSPEVDQFFQEARASIAYEGATINVNAHKNMMATVAKDKELESQVQNAEAIYTETSKNKRTVTPAATGSIDSSTRLANEKQFKALEEKVIESVGRESYEALDYNGQIQATQEYIDTLSDTKLAKQYKNILTTTEQIIMENERSMSKPGKAAVGYVNIPFKGLRNVAEQYGMNSVDRQILSSAFYVLEEDNISRKNTIGTGLSLTNKLVDTAKLLTRGGEDGRLGAEQFKEILNGIEADSFVKYASSHTLIGEFEGLQGEEYKSALLNRFNSSIDALADIFDQNSNAANTYASSIAGSNANRWNIDRIEQGRTVSGIRSLDLDGYSVNQKSRLAQAAGSAAEEIIQGVSGSGLAKAALGLAAAVMMTGYIGGNPTVPADNQAQQMDNYESLQDEDLSIQQLPQGTGQGYVININAQSNKGKEHVAQAIQKAMQSSVTTDINIAMSMNDNTSVINSRTLEKLMNKII